MRLNTLLGMALAVAVVGCAGDDKPPQEPVAASEGAPKVPDNPGNSGEAKEKPAGEGQAKAAPTAAPATEKSQPNVADAAKAAAAAKDKKDPKKAPAAGATGKSGNLKAGDATVAEFVNVRSGAGMKSPVKRVAKTGDKVTIKECKAGWCQIGDGEWVAGRFLKQ